MRLSSTWIILVGALAFAGHARAEPLWHRAAITGELRFDDGIGEARGLELGVVGAGGELRLSSMVTVAALAIAVAPFGMTHDGKHAKAAPGGELALALEPFPDLPVRPFIRWSAGLLAYPGQPFLPGGDVYDFMLHLGVGVEVPLGEHLALAVHADYGHVSNGQGIAPINPSFDGYGGGLDISYVIAPNATRAASTGRLHADPVGGELVVDGTLGHGGDAWLGTGRARFVHRLWPHVAGQLEGEAGELGGSRFAELGGDTVATMSFGTFGAHAGFRDYAGIDTGVLQLQAEAPVTEASALVGTLIWEPSTYVSAARAGVGLRVMPLPVLAFDLGEGARRSLDGNAATSYTPYYGFDWRLPLPGSTFRLSVFGDRQISGITDVGLRLAIGEPGALWNRLR